MHKKYKIAIGILLGFVLILLLGSFVLSRVISNKVSEALERQNPESLQVSINRTSFSLFDRSLVLKTIFVHPTDSLLQALKENKLDRNSLPVISVSSIKLKGIQLIPLIFSKKLLINKLIIDDPLFQQFSNGDKKVIEEEKKPLNLDSIFIKQIKGFQLDLISVQNLKVQMIDMAKDNEITFENDPLDFEASGFKLEQVSPNIFKLEPLTEFLEISNIKMQFPDVKYDFSIDQLKYHYEQDYIQLSNFKYKPEVDKLTLANSYTFNKEVFDLVIQDIKIYHPDTEKIIKNQGIFIDSIIISELDLEIYKDKRKPFDEKRRPQFPYESLKSMETPLLIPKIVLQNSKLMYEEKLEDKDILMIVNMADLHVDLINVTSIKAYRSAPLEIDLKTKLMGNSDLNLTISLPLADDQDTFYFNGYLGPGSFSFYDSAIIPALGLKILNGELESLSFEGSANSQQSSGTMKMVYKDLQAEVFKHKNNNKNSFLSWSVNSLIHKSNPGRNGKLREATMSFDRVPYKGFGNILWKTLQNGIVNSIAPFGKTTEKVDTKKKKQEKRERRKKDQPKES